MAIRTRQDAPGTPPGGTGTGDGDDDDAALTEGQAKQVEALVNTAVNGAITNQLSRFKKTFSEEITKTLGETLNPLAEQLKQISAGQAQSGQQGGAGGGQAKGGSNAGLPPEIAEQLARFEGRTKELEGQLAHERKAREEEKSARERDRAEAMSKEERATLAGVLRQRGIPDPQVRAAVALLHGEEKAIGRAEDGSMVFKIAKGTGAAKYIDEVALEAGVDEWLKTDDGKAFVPARQANGAGGLPARPGQKQGPGDARASATASLAAALLGGGG